jgi:hypothetical protein
MTARPNSIEGTAAIPPNVQDAIDAAYNLVSGPVDDLDAMFRLGAATVFRTVAKTDPHWHRTIDAIDNIGEQAGLYDANHRQKLIDAGFEDAKKPAPKIDRAGAPASATIITPADLEKFFDAWNEAIHTATDIPEKWAACIAAVRGKMLTMEIGRNIAERNLAAIAAALDLPAADLDAAPHMNGHDAAPIPERDAYGTVTARSPTSTPDEAKPALLSKAAFLADYTPPDWFWDGVMQRRFVYSITAKTGHGKTAVYLLISEKAASRDRRDTTVGGHQVDERNVIYFAGENPDDLRNRMIASDHLSGRDCSEDRISIIPGTFSIDAMRAECEAKIATLPGGKVDFIVVDTSAAYFLGDDENNNPQMSGHARKIRTLTTLPGGPCVGVLCHPVKNANEQSALLPRGGGAFIAEMDGNLTLWLTDDVTELWHTGKLRGPGFEPISFRLERVACEALVDTKGRMSPTVRAVAITDSDKEAEARTVRSAEDTMLVAILEQARPIAALAAACGWVSSGGEPQKSKAHRILKGLEKSGLVRLHRGAYELTERGDKAAKSAVRTSAAQ